MKRRILAGFMALMLCLTLLPTAVFAAEQDTPSAVYVSSSGGDDTAGDGTKDKPYATLSKAVDAAEDGATIYVMSNLGMKDCARIDSKNLTITSLDGENSPYTITRSEKFSMISDNARSWYNPAMIEVQTATGSAGLTLTNIILDDDNSHEGTVFAQAISGDGKTDNTVYVQDAIIASNATVPCTITLGEGAVLRNFGGMSALRATDQAKIVMESGSVIEDTLDNLTRNKGTDTKSVGPAGAIWIQGGTFVMEKGSKIQNVNGRAVYADDGVVEIGGTISGITANSDMWQGANGTVVHLRNDAEGTLTGEISNCTDGVLVFVDKASFEMTTGSFLGNSAAAGIKTNEDPPKNADTSGYDTNRNTIKIDGEIAGITGNKNPIQFKYGKLTIASNAYIHNNKVNYGTLYIQKEAIVDIYGKINGNDAEKKGGGIATPGHGSVTINLYDGAEIKNNTAGESGGGIMISSNTTFNMYGGEISGNISKETGGGIYQNKPSSEIRLLGGTIKDNIMNATDISDSTTGEKNDLAISSNGYGNKAHFFYVSDDIALGNKAVYFQTDAKTVTPAADSLDIKLGNTSSENVTALTNASTATGWGNPLATFWAQRDGAAKLTVGGLTGLDSNLPVYVLALPVSDTGAVSDVPAQVYAAQKTSEADAVSFTLPDISDNGYAIAVVQPTADYGELTINGTPSIEEIKNTENYTVTYTATYTILKPSRIRSSIPLHLRGNGQTCRLR